MRIAYLLHWNEGPESGVFKKVSGQAGQWRRAGHAVQIFLCGRDGPALDAYRATAMEIPITAARYHSAISRFARMGDLARAIAQSKSDVVYHRYDQHYPAVAELARQRPMVMEINSDDVRECASGWWVRRWYNRLTRGRLLAQARGLAFVTHELSQRPHFARFRKPWVVIGNGIDLAQYPTLAPAQNATPVLVFIGSSGQAWHGLDRIVALARTFPEWRFHLIGVLAKQTGPEPPPDNVRVHGFLKRAEYLPLLAGADVALGTLALERIGLTEACPLKVREYLACGLPVILGYRDTDFPNPVPFLLSLNLARSGANTRATASGGAFAFTANERQQLAEFVAHWRGRRVDRFAIRSLDTTTKEHCRLRFFAECSPVGPQSISCAFSTSLPA